MSSVLPRDPAGPPAPALAPPSVSGHRTLVDCKVKLAFLQMVLGFRGSVRAALGMLHPPAEPLHSSSAGEKAVGEALRWEPLLGQRRRGCVFKNQRITVVGCKGSVNKKGMSNMLINLATTRDERDSKVK